jgi:hypothetical protein
MKIIFFDELKYLDGSLLRGGMFNGCTNLQYVSVPYTRASLFNDNVSSYIRITLSGEWPLIVDTFIWGSTKNSLKAIVLESKKPPVISTIVGFFYGNHTTNYAKIYVPDESLDSYKSADVWKDYKGYIYPMSEYHP